MTGGENREMINQSINQKSLTPFCLPQKTIFFLKACNYQRIQLEPLCYSLKESLFYME